jgi:hypothetical protein
MTPARLRSRPRGAARGDVRLGCLGVALFIDAIDGLLARR